MQQTDEVRLKGVDVANVGQNNSRNQQNKHNRSGAVAGPSATLPGSSLYPAVYAHKPYQR